jgi:hypothetical protein
MFITPFSRESMYVDLSYQNLQTLLHTLSKISQKGFSKHNWNGIWYSHYTHCR